MKSRIVFLSREPVLSQLGGSVTTVVNLLEVLVRHDAQVSFVATISASRSPRLWFQMKTPVPQGVEFVVPGYIRFGKLYVNPFSAKAWARFLSRLAAHYPIFIPLRSLLERIYGDALYTTAWDLTTPTEDERAMALRAIEDRSAGTVIVNYAFWAPLFDETPMHPRKKVIMMHDMLSERVARFRTAGIPLDCPPIDETTEMSWLDRADTVMASQPREAEEVRRKVRGRVLVQPIVFAVERARAVPEPGRCLFIGSNIPPNMMGIRWLLAEVWPRVLAARPDAVLAVAGAICESVPDGAPQVEKLGRVTSMDDAYARASVCVVPLLLGTGLKVKLIEALGHGKAVVSTTVGVQGVEDRVPGVVEVTDDPVEFAAAMVRLLEDDALRLEREEAALAFVQTHYSADATLDPEFVAAML